MTKDPYPKKGISSYLLPFLLIILLGFSGWYLLQNEIKWDHIQRLIQAPEVSKDEKVTLAYQDEGIQIKEWNANGWKLFTEEDFFEPGDSVKTIEGGFAVLRFFEETELRLDQNTELKFVNLEKDDQLGHHISVELLQGQVWVRYPHMGPTESDFLLSSANQIVQLDNEAVMNVRANPDSTSSLGGSITINVVEERTGNRRPIGRIQLNSGEMALLDQLNRDTIKASTDESIIEPLANSLLDSAWGTRNLAAEEELGFIAGMTGDLETTRVVSDNLDPWPGEGVSVDSPLSQEEVGAWVLVQGTVSNENITAIQVNGEEATLGLNNDWEARVRVSRDRSTLTTTVTLNDEENYLLEEREVIVDDQAPVLGDILNPEVDENNSGTTPSSLELRGEVSADATRVCVSHNGAEPYCLQQFTEGSTTYRYLGSVGYGNVIEGINTYEVIAYDSYNNVSRKKVFLQYGDSTELLETSSPSDQGSSESATEPPRPVINSPDPSSTFQTSEEFVEISGTVPGNVQTLLINDKAAQFDRNTGAFVARIDIDRGETLIKVQSVAPGGAKSKTTLLRVLSFEDLSEEENSASDSEESTPNKTQE